MRQTPLPSLRDLAPDVLIVRCGLCNELVLAAECCGSPLEAPACPRRAMLESRLPLAGLQPAINVIGGPNG